MLRCSLLTPRRQLLPAPAGRKSGQHSASDCAPRRAQSIVGRIPQQTYAEERFSASDSVCPPVNYQANIAVYAGFTRRGRAEFAARVLP